MMILLQNLFRRLRDYFAERFTAAAPEPPDEVANGQGEDTPGPEQNAYQQFQGDAQEATALLMSPHVEIRKSSVLTRVQQDGTIPGSSEFETLTAAGRVLNHIDYVVCDDLGNRGKASDISAPCRQCHRIAFNSKPCSICGENTCLACSAMFEQDGQEFYLCKPCHQKAEFHHDNWLNPRAHKPQLPQADDYEPEI